MEFGTLEHKEKIIERKKRLGQEPIYIEHDKTREKRDIQREIVRYATRLKEDNREVKIRFKKIEVVKIWYR